MCKLYRNYVSKVLLVLVVCFIQKRVLYKFFYAVALAFPLLDRYCFYSIPVWFLFLFLHISIIFNSIVVSVLPPKTQTTSITTTGYFNTQMHWYVYEYSNIYQSFLCTRTNKVLCARIVLQVPECVFEDFFSLSISHLNNPTIHFNSNL